MLTEAKHDHIRSTVDNTLEVAKENGLTNAYWDYLTTLVNDNFDIFGVEFSFGSPAYLLPLRIELTTQASLVRCRLRKY